MWITLEQIEALNAVKESGSLNGASEQLFKAKSAISYSINKLEDQLQFKLLNKSGYRSILTPEAEAFLVKAKEILSLSNNLKNYASQISNGIEMKLSLSATEIYPLSNMNKILKKLTKLYPSTEFTFHREILSGEKMLEQDIVDLAIFEDIKDRANIEYREIMKIQLSLVIAGDHPFLEIPKSKRNFKKLFEYPQIIQRSTIRDDSYNVGVYKNSKKWSVSDTYTKKLLIKDGLGWGRLPHHEIDKEIKTGKLVALKELNEDVSATIFLGRKKGRPMGQVSQFLWNEF